MEKVVWKGSTLLGPLPPALVSCGTLEQPNALTVAWTGIVNSQPPKTYVSIRPCLLYTSFINLKGHRSVGGMRASIYNALPAAGVEKLTDFMRAFEKANG